MIVNGKRALAHTEKVSWIKPIEGADNIELIGVLGWSCIAKIGEFHEGDLCVYIEIDSKCPEKEWSEFLRTKHFKVKTMKLGKFGVVSQGLALPLSVFNVDIPKEEGVDVTDLLGVTYSVKDDNKRKGKGPDKYQRMAKRHPKIFKKKIIRNIMKHQLGRRLMYMIFGNYKQDETYRFPKTYEHIHVTDEERVENCPWVLESPDPWVVTTKIDGTSSTYILERGKCGKYNFYVYSRNIRQYDAEQDTFHDSNVYWEAEDKYDIEFILTEIMESMSSDMQYICLQGEIAGPNIQKNPHKFDELRFFGFNFITSDEGRWDTERAAKLMEKYNIPWVPIVDTEYYLPNTMEEFKAAADGECEAPGATGLREGYVYRSKDGKRSFKNVSVKYLLKKGE